MPRKKPVPQNGETENKQAVQPTEELTASYGDVLDAARLSHCSVHPNATHLTIVQYGKPANVAIFAKTPQGFGQAIAWMDTLAPVKDNIRSITETALFYALNSLALPLTIERLPDTGLYAWQVLGTSGEATSFVEALKKALNHLMQEYQRQEQRNQLIGPDQ